MINDRRLHREELENALQLHRDELSKVMLQSKKEHLMGTYSQLESHFVQLDADLVNALKVCVRKGWGSQDEVVISHH